METAHFTVETRISHFLTVETRISHFLTVGTWAEHGVGLDSGLLGAMFVIALFFFLFLLGNVSNLTGQTAYRLLPNPCGGPSWRHVSQSLLLAIVLLVQFTQTVLMLHLKPRSNRGAVLTALAVREYNNVRWRTHSHRGRVSLMASCF